MGTVKKIAKLSSLLALMLLPVGVSAETLDLRAALVMGLQHNFDLKVAQLDVTRAEAGVMGQEGRFDVVAELAAGMSEAETPTASAFYPGDTVESESVSGEVALSKQFSIGLQSRLSLQGERAEGVSSDGLSDQLDPSYRANLILDLKQPLLRDIGLSANTADLKVAETRSQQAALGYLGRAQGLVVEIERAYLEVVQASEEYDYYALARDLAKELVDGNERKYEAGLIPVTEVNEARAAMAGREEAMVLSRQRLELARNGLANLLFHGDAGQPTGDWEAVFPELSDEQAPLVEDALAIGFEQRPDLRQARLETEARKIQLAYAGNQRWPQLDLEASLGLNGLAGDDGGAGSIYAGKWGDALDGALNEDGTQWYAGLRFNLPLQNRAARARYNAAEAEDLQAIYSLRRVEVAAETAIRSAVATLNLGEQRLEVARRYASLAETTLDQETRRLNEGLSDTFRVLTFQNALVEAKIREVAAQVDYHKALSVLYESMGTNLDRYDIVAALPREGVQP